MGARLYVIPGSHPSMSARLMLERKGIPYRRTDLIPVVSKGVVRAARFPGVTVPALSIDGDRIQGSRQIARALERVKPVPPLFPADPERRAAVEAAEAWGDGEPQERARRILWWTLRNDVEPMRSFIQGARLGVPAGVAVRTAGPIVWAAGRLNQASDANVRADLAALPGMLDRIDRLIADGVIGSDEPNAADYQLAPSVRLLMTLDDLRPGIEERPAGRLALKVVPDFPGRVPPALPADWLPSELGPRSA